MVNGSPNFLVDNAVALANDYIECGANQTQPLNYMNYNSFSAAQKVVFVQTLMYNYTTDATIMANVDAGLNITYSTDPDILERWYTLGLWVTYSYMYTPCMNWVTTMGRSQYLQSIFTACSQSGSATYNMCLDWYNVGMWFWTPLSRTVVEDCLYLS